MYLHNIRIIVILHIRTLTWHNEAIPAKELWIKLGGDKGQESFKLNIQLVNTCHPNSIKNTTLVAVFKAGDSRANLHTALDQYKEQIEELEGMKWKYVNKVTT